MLHEYSTAAPLSSHVPLTISTSAPLPVGAALPSPALQTRPWTHSPSLSRSFSHTQSNRAGTVTGTASAAAHLLNRVHHLLASLRVSASHSHSHSPTPTPTHRLPGAAEEVQEEESFSLSPTLKEQFFAHWDALLTHWRLLARERERDTHTDRNAHTGTVSDTHTNTHTHTNTEKHSNILTERDALPRMLAIPLEGTYTHTGSEEGSPLTDRALRGFDRLLLDLLREYSERVYFAQMSESEKEPEARSTAEENLHTNKNKKHGIIISEEQQLLQEEERQQEEELELSILTEEDREGGKENKEISLFLSAQSLRIVGFQEHDAYHEVRSDPHTAPREIAFSELVCEIWTRCETHVPYTPHTPHNAQVPPTEQRVSFDLDSLRPVLCFDAECVSPRSFEQVFLSPHNTRTHTHTHPADQPMTPHSLLTRAPDRVCVQGERVEHVFFARFLCVCPAWAWEDLALSSMSPLALARFTNTLCEASLVRDVSPHADINSPHKHVLKQTSLPHPLAQTLVLASTLPFALTRSELRCLVKKIALTVLSLPTVAVQKDNSLPHTTGTTQIQAQAHTQGRKRTRESGSHRTEASFATLSTHAEETLDIALLIVLCELLCEHSLAERLTREKLLSLWDTKSPLPHSLSLQSLLWHWLSRCEYESATNTHSHAITPTHAQMESDSSHCVVKHLWRTVSARIRQLWDAHRSHSLTHTCAHYQPTLTALLQRVHRLLKTTQTNDLSSPFVLCEQLLLSLFESEVSLALSLTTTAAQPSGLTTTPSSSSLPPTHAHTPTTHSHNTPSRARSLSAEERAVLRERELERETHAFSLLFLCGDTTQRIHTLTQALTEEASSVDALAVSIAEEFVLRKARSLAVRVCDSDSDYSSDDDTLIENSLRKMFAARLRVFRDFLSASGITGNEINNNSNKNNNNKNNKKGFNDTSISAATYPSSDNKGSERGGSADILSLSLPVSAALRTIDPELALFLSSPDPSLTTFTHTDTQTHTHTHTPFLSQSDARQFVDRHLSSLLEEEAVRVSVSGSGVHTSLSVEKLLQGVARVHKQLCRRAQALQEALREFEGLRERVRLEKEE